MSTGATNEARKDLIDDVVTCGYTDVRVAQQQLDASGGLVGDNRPDIQATSPTGIREHWVLDDDPTGTGRLHEVRILANDQDAVVHVISGRTFLTCGS